jgi:hypothetical protein
MSKTMMGKLLILPFTCLTFFGLGEFGLFHSNTQKQLMLSSPKPCVIISSVSYFFEDLQKKKNKCTLGVGSIANKRV